MSYRFQAESHELWATSAYQHPDPLQIAMPGAPEGTVERLLMVPNQATVSFPAVILPDICAHLVLHYLADGRFRASMVGPRSQSKFIDRKKRSSSYILRLQPGALAMLNNFPAVELLDRSVPLSSLVDPATAEYLELNDVHPPHELLSRCLTTLHASVNQGSAPVVKQFIYLARMGQLPLTVRELARDLGVSDRYLRRIVKAQVGMPPKAVLRLLRFRISLLARQNHPMATWSEIAQRAGYYDQSHLIDEYQRFLGSSPERFFRQ